MSISVVADAIERSLYLVSSSENFRPEVITVLSGGYEPGYSFEEDILVMETRIRVLKGVKRWKENPEALLIMSGAEYIEGRNNSRLSDLMTSMAVIAGVQKHKILVDTLSRNTFEHPQRILELPGVSPQSLVEVVTSKWHMRRAIWSFQEIFTNVQPSPFSQDVVK
ncbi:MAG: YdcF family protein, partial [Fidelibacterota bacterium]